MKFLYTRSSSLLRILPFLFVTLFLLSAQSLSADIKAGDATVTNGSTTTVTIASTYARTLAQSSSVYATWTASSSAISIQSRTNTSCTIKGNTTGKAKLTYKCSYIIDGFQRTMNFYYDITIKSNTIEVTSVSLSTEYATLEIGETLQLTATAYPTNATNRSISWSSDDNSVATVSSNGLVTAKAAGKVWIRARATDGSGSGNFCVVTVNAPQPRWLSVILPNGSFDIDMTSLKEISVRITPDDGFRLHSATLDGVSLDTDGSDNSITISRPDSDAVLYVVFVSDQLNGIESAISDAGDDIRLSVDNQTVTVSGIDGHQQISVYNTSGMLIGQTFDPVFTLQSHGIYIIRVGARSFKLSV